MVNTSDNHRFLGSLFWRICSGQSFYFKEKSRINSLFFFLYFHVRLDFIFFPQLVWIFMSD
ncbi:hypothetical protein HanIR_Chr12g0594881 [Helianthus annuus]|nr:hypothetical protein HanIR_Chr12g0594881 [Helianthus annuus]